MKKILLAVAAVATFASCSQNEEFENVGQKAEIGFNSVISKSTRAAIVENDDFKSFTVNGYRTAAEITTSTQLEGGFMDDVPVAKDAQDNSWKQTDTFYWPANGYVSFFATSPAQSLDIKTVGYPKFEYTVGAIDTQKDLLAANLKNQQKTDSKVALAFRHLLTQVNFAVKGDTKGFNYVISKLEITGVNTTATFTFDGVAGTVGGWSAASTVGSYTYDLTKSPQTITVTDPAKDPVTNLESANNSLFMLMPQTLTDAAKVSVTYYAIPTDKVTANNDLDKTFSGTKTVALGTTTKWEANKKVRYTLVLSSDAKPIEMGEPTVTGWDASEVNGGEVTPVTPPTV